jgi:hypothetical protein
LADEQKLRELEFFSQYLYQQFESIAQNIKIDKLKNEEKFQEFNKTLVGFETLNKSLFVELKELRQSEHSSKNDNTNINNNNDNDISNSSQDLVSLMMDKYLSKEFETMEDDIEKRLRNEIDIKFKNKESKKGNSNLLGIFSIIVSVSAMALVFFGLLK